MKYLENFYIDGQWVKPHGTETTRVVNPANLQVCLTLPNANAKDVDHAFAAARRAFASWSITSGAERQELLNRVADEMERRTDDFIDAHVETLGVPRHQAHMVHIEAPVEAMRYFASLAPNVDDIERVSGMLVTREPVGVCALINPWNYPLLQMVGKVAPALAAGCTVVEKPSEQTPSADYIMAEIFDKVGLPAGVFNLLNGVGAEIGPLMSKHAEADMVSFTGSTRAGVSVAIEAAPTVKRVCQELGGKSPFIITGDADLSSAIKYGVDNVFLNAGQTCDALTRMLVPQELYADCIKIVKQVAAEHRVGDPEDPASTVGPLVSEQQRQRVADYIALGEQEGADVIVGGSDLPDRLKNGAYVVPTVFGRVTPEMRIAQEEIFGPVLCVMTYQTIEEAIAIANDTEFGLSAAVWAKDREDAVAIAKKLRVGQCFIQGGFFRVDAPFGGFKQSGNGREWGVAGLAEYLETKAIIGE